MRKLRTLEAERRQVLRASVSTGEKEDELNTGRVWAAGFNHDTASSHLGHILKLINRLFI
jgi:plasmid stability protein